MHPSGPLCSSLLCHAVLRCAALCCAVLRCAVLCHAVLCCAVLGHAVPSLALPCHAMPCHAMPRLLAWLQPSADLTALLNTSEEPAQPKPQAREVWLLLEYCNKGTLRVRLPTLMMPSMRVAVDPKLSSQAL